MLGPISYPWFYLESVRPSKRISSAHLPSSFTAHLWNYQESFQHRTTPTRWSDTTVSRIVLESKCKVSKSSQPRQQHQQPLYIPKDLATTPQVLHSGRLHQTATTSTIRRPIWCPRTPSEIFRHQKERTKRHSFYRQAQASVSSPDISIAYHQPIHNIRKLGFWQQWSHEYE